ncbi:hypothetical protein RvY_10977 [Ramazzottius varieornatus]|uniref:Receptor ligand binding region domain-containing protein n=1 Tax=Ramazzottius varieornatus TaxID=947166 RepID=A0A1D1VH12_RAMVA|nr:hypothetical protein RvY_10977 [Ramazzottius varieornatus]
MNSVLLIFGLMLTFNILEALEGGNRVESNQNKTGVCKTPEVTVLIHVAYQFVDVISSVDVAVEEMNFLYDGRFSLIAVPFTTKSKFFCEQLADETADIAASFYYRRPRCPGTSVFLSPYCAPDFLMLARITAEWNVPVFSILGTFSTESTKYPTAISAAPTHNAVFAAFLKKFLLYYKWTTVFLLCDDKRDVGYFRANCENFKQQLAAPIFKVRFINFDSGMDSVDYSSHLNSVRKAARGTIRS